MTVVPAPFTQGELLTSVALDAEFNSKADVDSGGHLLDSEMPADITAAIAAAQAAATAATQAAATAQAAAAAAQTAATNAQATATSAATAASAAQATAAAAQAAAGSSGGGGSRVWSVFAGNSNATTSICELSAGVGVDHVHQTDIGLYTVFLTSGTVLPPNHVVASGAEIPAFSVNVGAWIGLLPGATDDTVAIGGLNRQAAQPWGMDPESGLYFLNIRLTFQAQVVSSPTGESWAAVFLQVNW